MVHGISSRTLLRSVPADGGSVYQWAAGTTTITSEGIDTLGYNAARIFVKLGAITSGGVQSVKVQQSDDDAVADAYSDIAGTSQSWLDTEDDTIRMVDIYKPGKRWLTVVVARATQNSAIDGIMVELYNPAQSVVSQHATVSGCEFFNQPAEGTA